MNSEKKRVCIVGGGPTGLSTLRRVLESSSLTGTAFEQKDDVGGVWNYKGEKSFPTSPKNASTEQSGHEKDPEGVTTMYDNLMCNVAFPLLEFWDFKHSNPTERKTYTSQKEMHQYFRNYTSHFNLWSHIELNTSVVNIRPEDPTTKEGEPCRWIVETHNHKEDILTTSTFDAVVICTGKNHYPHMPDLPGMEDFQGRLIHSKFFKNAEEFQGQHVVLMGFGATSADLSLHLSRKASKVTVCHKFPYGFNLGLLPPNVCEKQTIKRVTSNAVVTSEEEIIPCDAVILCTGFDLKYPFLDKECGLEIWDNKYIPHLYKMTVFTKRPTLFFPNMVYRAPEIVFVQVQDRYIVSCLEGKLKLPSFEEMEAVVSADEDERRKQGQRKYTQ